MDDNEYEFSSGKNWKYGFWIRGLFAERKLSEKTFLRLGCWLWS